MAFFSFGKGTKKKYVPIICDSGKDRTVTLSDLGTFVLSFKAQSNYVITGGMNYLKNKV